MNNKKSIKHEKCAALKVCANYAYKLQQNAIREFMIHQPFVKVCVYVCKPYYRPYMCVWQHDYTHYTYVIVTLSVCRRQKRTLPESYCANVVERWLMCSNLQKGPRFISNCPAKWILVKYLLQLFYKITLNNGKQISFKSPLFSHI